MNKKDWVQIKTVVTGALALEPAERHTYIRQTCDGNDRLLREVEEQLRFITESEEIGFLENPGGDRRAFVQDLSRRWNQSVTPTELIGQRIGPYEIVNELGSGGMGAVYKAERVDGTFQHTTAIKLIKHDAVSEETIHRFKQEREILASLAHPNIAQLYDGGVTPDGIPYLIMEFVDGESIDRWCDEKQCRIEERLALFQKACEAIQFAHQNMIIHRDLKPQNIFVSTDGQVKILDFGIAKMLEPIHPDQKVVETRSGSQLWTPQFAAPEQVTGKNIGIATDIYALGALLYTLLGGEHPFDFTGKSTYEIESLILKDDPPPASKRVIKADQKIWKSRALNEGKQLQKILQGDLDAIMLKAMRREPKFRYQSVNELLDDLQRYESDLPLRAREDTLRYRSSKFWKRHKTGVLGAVLLVGITVTYIFQITQERNQARLEAQKAQEVSEFLTDMFRASNPTFEPGKDITATMLLERGKNRIEQLDEQQAIQTQLLSVIGRAYLDLGKYEQAKPLLTQSLDLRKKQYASEAPEIAIGLDDFATLQRVMGDFAAAESLHRSALAIRKSSLGYSHEKTAESLYDIGFVLAGQKAYTESDSVLNEALNIYEKIYHPNHVEIARVLNAMASNYRAQGNYKEAHRLYQQSLEIWKNEYGTIHPQVAEGTNDLAVINKFEGNISVADSLYNVALGITSELYEGPHPNIAQTLTNLGVMWQQQGNYKKGQSYLEKALIMRRSLFRKQHPKIAASLNNLATLYFGMEQYDQAEPLWKEALEIDKINLGEKHPYVGGDLMNLGRLYQKQTKYEKAKTFLIQSRDILQKALPANHPFLLKAQISLGTIYLNTGQPSRSKKIFSNVLKIQEKSVNKRHWKIAQSQVLLGASLMALKEYVLSETMLKRGYQTLKKEKSPHNIYTQKARKYLVELYRETDRMALCDSIDAAN